MRTMNDLFQIEPSEEEMYHEAISQPLDRKVDSAVEQMAMELYGEVPCDVDCQNRFMTV